MSNWWLLTVVVFASGYWLGRSEGIHRGERLAQAQTPLDLREQALRSGRCPVCLSEVLTDEGENCQDRCAVIE